MGIEAIELDEKTLFIKTLDENIISEIKSFILQFREENIYN